MNRRAWWGILALLGWSAAAKAQPLQNPILFVAQTPYRSDFATVLAVIGNQRGDAGSAPRGGGLMIVYPDGTLRDLTLEAGYGATSDQLIAVRNPCVHWSGERALFSMVIGGVTQNDLTPVYWQIYEVRGLGEGQSAQITKVANQPAGYNNVSPAYSPDGRILFATDRPRDGNRALYPQLDEYESQPTNTGLWSLDPASGDLRLLDHAVSGLFSPSVAQDGRIIFSRWDHLQRDQQADADAQAEVEGQPTPYGSFDDTFEGSGVTAPRQETYPEPRSGDHGHTINQFFPWQILPDGSDLETLNHVGRHELVGYFNSSQPGLPEFIAPEEEQRAENFLQIREDPRPDHAGAFYGVSAMEFATHAAGQILRLPGAESVNPDDMRYQAVTHPNTSSAYEPEDTIPQPHDGLFRDPLPLQDGRLLAAHSPGALVEGGGGSPLGSDRYSFRLRLLTPGPQGYLVAGSLVTPGVSRSISYFDNGPYTQVSYSGLMWEVEPVEVAPRPTPPVRQAALPELERDLLEQLLADRGGTSALRDYLQSRGLALLISRDVTRRADRQQPYNLSIPGGVVSSEPNATPEPIQWIRFFQADQVRGYSNYRAGRRPLARVMHGLPEAPEGRYELGQDGSFAALVPARRALSWQLEGPDGSAVVRERYWVTFQPGEIRVCKNCHGINHTDVLGNPPPTNPPQALQPLLAQLQFGPRSVPALGFMGALAFALLLGAFWKPAAGSRRGGG